MYYNILIPYIQIKNQTTINNYKRVQTDIDCAFQNHKFKSKPKVYNKCAFATNQFQFIEIINKGVAYCTYNRPNVAYLFCISEKTCISFSSFMFCCILAFKGLTSLTMPISLKIERIQRAFQLVEALGGYVRVNFGGLAAFVSHQAL